MIALMLVVMGNVFYSNLSLLHSVALFCHVISMWFLCCCYLFAIYGLCVFYVIAMWLIFSRCFFSFLFAVWSPCGFYVVTMQLLYGWGGGRGGGGGGGGD